MDKVHYRLGLCKSIKLSFFSLWWRQSENFFVIRVSSLTRVHHHQQHRLLFIGGRQQFILKNIALNRTDHLIWQPSFWLEVCLNHLVSMLQESWIGRENYPCCCLVGWFNGWLEKRRKLSLSIMHIREVVDIISTMIEAHYVPGGWFQVF